MIVQQYLMFFFMGIALYFIFKFLLDVALDNRRNRVVSKREKPSSMAPDLAELAYHKITTLDEAIAMAVELKSAPSGLQPNLFPKAWEENKAHLIGWENAFRDAVGGPLLGPPIPQADPKRSLLPDALAEYYSQYPLVGMPANGLPSLSKEWQWVSMGGQKWRTERVLKVDPYAKYVEYRNSQGRVIATKEMI